MNITSPSRRYSFHSILAFLITLSTLPLSTLPLVTESHAQTFVPIVKNYECAQFPDGSEYLVKRTATGFALVKTAEVKESFNKERRILKQRIGILNEALRNFQKARISKSKLISTTNSIIAKLLGGDKIPATLPPDDVEVRVFNIKQELLNKDQVLKTIGDLINACGKGLTVKKGRGTPIGVSISPVSAATSNTIYGGFIISAPKIQKSGYNVCLKLIFPDGTGGSFYSGFGDDTVCYPGAGKFEGVPSSTCKGFLPRGHVGYLIQKRSYAFTSLPDASTAELLDRIRIEVLQDQPIVGVMVFPFNLSRDASIRACQAF